MNVCTTRLPGAAAGVATVILIYIIGRRLFDTPTGLLAAAVLATCPWHVQYSRWGHESSIDPFLFAASMVAFLWMANARRQRAAAGFAAGAITGIACYAYAAMRLVVPVTLVAVVLCAPRRSLAWGRQRQNRGALIALIAGLAITTGPLFWKQLTDPLMSRRAQFTRAWTPDDPIEMRIAKVAKRYFPHFGPNFLFLEGTSDRGLSPPAGYGWLNWYALPPLVVGTGVLLGRFGSSIAARVLVSMLLAYPAGDVLFGQGTEPHPMRSFAGVVPLSLTAAVGALWAARWIAQRNRRIAAGIVIASIAAALVSHVVYLRVFFGPFNDDPAKYWQRNVDLLEACHWLRQRIDEVDAVFITQERIAFPHAPVLVYLGYDPRRWFNEPREYEPGPPTLPAQLVCTRFGKIRLMYDPQRAIRELDALRASARRERVVMILRPDEQPGSYKPVAEVRHAGRVWLRIYEFDL
jgi:hypothetical protein